MENSLNFKIGNESFSILKLIDSSRFDSEADRLIKMFENNVKDCMNNEPFKEDLIGPCDNWSNYASESLGISFEFIEDQFCYISFNLKLNPSMIITFLKDVRIIVGLIINEKDQVTNVSFGSKTLIYEEELYPSRWSPILESLIIGQCHWK